MQEGLPAKRKTLRDYVDIPTPEQVKAIGAWVSVSAITYFGLWFMLGEIMKPGESGAATFLLWAFAHGGAWVCQRVGLPPLLGMLLAGLFLRNIPGGLVDGLRHSWSEVIRSGGLALILLRSGLELDWRAVKRVGWIAARLTACPGISEAVTAGLLSGGSEALAAGLLSADPSDALRLCAFRIRSDRRRTRTQSSMDRLERRGRAEGACHLAVLPSRCRSVILPSYPPLP